MFIVFSQFDSFLKKNSGLFKPIEKSVCTERFVSFISFYIQILLISVFLLFFVFCFVFYISLEVKPISWLTVLVSRSKDKNKYTFSGDKHYVKEEEG